MGADSGLTDPKSKSILVVEDDEGSREFLVAVVRKEGFQAREAGDGREALKLVEAARPDLMILDMMLPRMGGYEVLRQLQEWGLSSLPVIVVTGRCKDTSTTEMIRRESNVVEFMEKPVRPVVLGMCLHRILRTKAP